MNLYVVTGTTKGLGQALASRIQADTSNILVSIARSPAATPQRGLHIRADLGVSADITRAGEEMTRFVTGQSFERAVLINNAGVVSPVAPLEQADPAQLERNLVVNLVAPVLLMRAFLRATQGVGLRRVINISSGAGRRPVSGWTGYCSAKAGLDMASRVAALEARARGLAVEVASLAPGVVDTDMQTQVRSQSPDAFVDVARFKHMKEAGELRPPADVAADILRAEREGRLAGDDAVLDLRSLGV